MKVTLRTTEHYAVRPYEWIEIGAEVESEISEPEHYDTLDTALDMAMATGRDRAQALATNHESFIHDHPALTGES